jgi:hypothetical protein
MVLNANNLGTVLPWTLLVDQCELRFERSFQLLPSVDRGSFWSSLGVGFLLWFLGFHTSFCECKGTIFVDMDISTDRYSSLLRNQPFSPPNDCKILLLLPGRKGLWEKLDCRTNACSCVCQWWNAIYTLPVWLFVM